MSDTTLTPNHDPALAHHFNDLEQQHEAATLGMWAFLAQEVLFFGGVFTAYAVYRHRFPEAFHEASQHLDIVLGTINTTALLTSSLTMALAVQAAQWGRQKATFWFIFLTFLLGMVFMGIKVVEYSDKFAHHLVPGPNFNAGTHSAAVDPHNIQLFFSFYFVMTGLHALHMIIGVAILLWIMLGVPRGKWMGPRATFIEMTGLYWHLVDLVWIFLFPLLYLIGR
ncbi:MAG: cytochrome c oxidase subunit 3 family protein [Phycisphaeraceae bacterium]